MQVSWIDADRIKALVAQIAPLETCTEETSGLVELDTTSESLQGNLPESWGFAMDLVEPTVRPAPAAPETQAKSPPETERHETAADADEEDEQHTDEHPLHNPAAALPLSRIRDKLRAIRQRASEAGILTRVSEVAPGEPASGIKINGPAEIDKEGRIAEPAVDGEDGTAADAAPKSDSEFTAAVQQAPHFEIPAGPRETRLAAFASWARQVLNGDGGHVLVMSDDGEVLWGGEAKAGLVLSTMMAWGAAIRASAMSACETPPVIHQTLASGNVLSVIPCETAEGMVHAAVAAPAGLTHAQAQLLRGALCSAMN